MGGWRGTSWWASAQSGCTAAARTWYRQPSRTRHAPAIPQGPGTPQGLLSLRRRLKVESARRLVVGKSVGTPAVVGKGKNLTVRCAAPILGTWGPRGLGRDQLRRVEPSREGLTWVWQRREGHTWVWQSREGLTGLKLRRAQPVREGHTLI